MTARRPRCCTRVPANFVDDRGEWRPIDEQLVPAEGAARRRSRPAGWENAAGPFNAWFAPTADDRSLVRLSVGDVEVAFGMESAGRVEGRVDGATVRYEDVAPGTHLDYEVSATHVKEVIELVRPPEPGEASSWRFPLTLQGLEAVTEADGTVALLDGTGTPVFRVPPGVAFDGGDEERGEQASAPVELRLVAAGDGQALEVSIDPAWLSDPARVYPVRIDPTFDAGNASGRDDAFISSAWPNGAFNSWAQWDGGHYVNKIGFTTFPTEENYSYLKFDLQQVMGKQIVAAQLRGWTLSKRSPGDWFWMYPVADPWNPGTITWNNPAHHRIEEKAVPNAVAGNFFYQDLTDWVQNWTTGAWANHGISMDTKGLDGYVRIAASEQATEVQPMAPALFITFSNKPNPPDQLSPAGGGRLATPAILSARFSDPDPDTAHGVLTFTVVDQAGQATSVTSPPLLNGQVGSVTLPSTLADGHYTWSVTAHDQDATASYSSPVQHVEIATSTPGLGDRSFFTYHSEALTDRSTAKVNVANGNLLVGAADAVLAGVSGSDMRIDRVYNSLASTLTAYGRGWTLPVGPGSGLFLGADGKPALYVAPSGWRAALVPAAPGTWTAPGSNLTITEQAGPPVTFVAEVHATGQRSVFDTDGWLVRHEDRNGNGYDVTYTLDPMAGRVVDELVDQRGRKLTFTYVNGYLDTVEDSDGRTWDYTIDPASGELWGVIDPAGSTTVYGYQQHLLTTVTDPRNTPTSIVYAPATGRVASFTRNAVPGATATQLATYPAGAPDCATFGLAGGPACATVVDARGHRTAYSVDPGGRVIATVDAVGDPRSTTYTSNGDVQSISDDAVSSVFRFGYDPATNALQTITSPASATGQGEATTTFSYDVKPYLPASQTDPQGNCRAHTYDAAGNLERTYDGLAPDANRSCAGQTSDASTEQRYVDIGVAKKLVDLRIDANGQTTDYGYNLDGELISIDHPGPLGDETFTYDDLSRRETRTDGKGQTSTIVYDGIDRVRQVRYGTLTEAQCNAASAPTGCVRYTYDANGNLTSRTDNTGTTTFTYDRLNRLVAKDLAGGANGCTVPGSSPLVQAEMTYAYDQVGNVATSCDAGVSATYGYDPVNRMITLAEPGGTCASTPGVGCTRIAHDITDGRRVRMTTYPTGQAVTMTEVSDPAGNLASIVARRGDPVTGTPVTGFTYTYADETDDTSLRQTATDIVAAVTTTYGYDAHNRLVAATGGAVDHHYDYDPAGNRTLARIGNQLAAAVHNPANQLTSRTVIDAPLDVDLFARPDGPLGTAPGGEAWRADAGTFAIADSAAKATGNGGGNWEAGINLASLDAGSANAEIEATLSLSAARVSSGLAFRVADGATHLMARVLKNAGMASPEVELYKRHSGGYTLLAATSTGAPALGTTVTMTVRADGNQIRVALDGTTVLSHTLSAADQTLYGANTRHGLYAIVANDDDDGTTRWHGYHARPLTVTTTGTTVDTDGFGRADGPLGTAPGGEAWRADSGSFAVAGNQAKATGNGGSNWEAGINLASLDAGTANAEIQATLSLSATRVSSGLAFRVANGATHLMARVLKNPGMSTPEVELYRRYNGGYTLLAATATGAPALGTTATMIVRADGNQIGVAINGTTVLTHTLSATDQTRYGTNTRHGLYAIYASPDDDDGATRWDDYQVTTLGAGTAPIPAITYDHDDNGNLTATSGGDGASFVYNVKDQTTTITPAGEAPFAMGYADLGQTERVQAGATAITNGPEGVIRTVGPNGTTRWYRDDTGRILVRRHTTGSTTTSHYYLYDGLGSVAAIIDSAGDPIDEYAYDPYGNRTDDPDQDVLEDPWQYAAGYHDYETGLTKFGARYYNPELGRWTQADPSRQDPHYMYARDNPVSYIDPSGLLSISDVLDSAGDVLGTVSTLTAFACVGGVGCMASAVTGIASVTLNIAAGDAADAACGTASLAAGVARPVTGALMGGMCSVSSSTAK